MSSLARKLTQIEQNIEQACRKAGRARKEVRVLLATKTIKPDVIREVAGLGYILCGENKAQELTQKVKVLANEGIRWDFIGHLQSNKVKDIIEHCTLIHSVDRLSLAEEISKRAVIHGKIARVLVEVNTSGEDSKSGVDPRAALSLCREISALDGIVIEGLMTLAENTDNEVAVRKCFRSLRELSLVIAQAAIPKVTMKELSMGMSQDYVIAIEEGATLVRLGSAVFGDRH